MAREHYAYEGYQVIFMHIINILQVPKSPDFEVKFRLEVKQGGGPNSQFYLMDIGGCWKNNGKPCDRDVTTDVTRYSEMIINPETKSWCKPESLKLCPPYHFFSNGTKIHRTDKENYPYDAYHLWCAPGNAEHVEEPYILCDPYSNPQAQEILQILPHPIWGEYGYPTKKGDGWIGDPRTWELDVGRLSQALYFYQVHSLVFLRRWPLVWDAAKLGIAYYFIGVVFDVMQDPGTTPVERHWTSIDLGTEIYISSDQVAEWIVSDFDIVVPKLRMIHE
jgi:hypothetical protein